MLPTIDRDGRRENAMRRLAALGCVVVLAVSGCGRLGDVLSAKNHRHVKVSELPGEWHSNCGTTLILRADGTATVTDLANSRRDRKADRGSGEAKWWFEDADADNQRIEVSLPTATTGPDLTTEIEVNGDGKTLTASTFLHDYGKPDDACDYRKTA
jgi:hypothetical protein